MHMSDALVSAPIALGADAIAATLLAISIRKIYRQERLSIPLMGVLGAFVFAAQMINFSIPGTGSSGHIIGGILLSSMLGAWGGFFTLCSVIVLQCLLFADGGLLALGCNAINMAAFSCLVAYPLIFKPLYRADCSTLKLFSASILANITAFLMGAIAVTLETTLSGVSALPLGRMLLFMLRGCGYGAGDTLCAQTRSRTLPSRPKANLSPPNHRSLCHSGIHHRRLVYPRGIFGTRWLGVVYRECFARRTALSHKRVTHFGRANTPKNLLGGHYRLRHIDICHLANLATEQTRKRR